MVVATISIDAMGGDDAPHITLRGISKARKYHPEVKFLIFGDKALLEERARTYKRLDKNIEIVHAPEVITGDMKPSVAVRQSKNTSMRMAIEAVKEGRAQAVVSAGNTGAYMALSKMILKTMDGIDRPAISAIMPSVKKDIVALDLGANIECSAENLVQFALMGTVFSKCVLGHPHPSVGLLNVGSEDLKGNTIVREAAKILAENPAVKNYHGFIEGTDIGRGTVDVVVTDGFTGNVTLKTIEGTALMIRKKLKYSLMGSLLSRLGSLFIAGSLKKFRQFMDPRRYNGAIFLGLNGVAVKSHGGTDSLGFSFAIGTAVDMVKNGVVPQIHQGLKDLQLTQNS